MNRTRLLHGSKAARLGEGRSRGMVSLVMALVAASAMLWGCGPKVAPGMIPVTGKVTVAGKPLDEAAICFKGKDNGFSNTARIVAGKFRTALKPGPYAIAVIAQEELFDDRGISTGFRQLIPVRYFTTESSGLNATVDAANRTVTLDLAP